MRLQKHAYTFVNSDPVVGRYMVAARDIEAGEVIFNDEPACIGESAVKRWPCKAALSKTLLGFTITPPLPLDHLEGRNMSPLDLSFIHDY